MAWVIPVVKCSLVLWLVLGGGIALPLDLRSPADLWSAVDTLAALTSLWLPGLGVAIAVPVLAVAPLYYSAGVGLASLLFTSVMAGIRWPWRRLVVLMALQAAFLLYDFVIVGTALRTVTLTGVLVVAYAVGRWIRRWLTRQHRGENRIASLARRTAHAREEERIALAKELATLLVRGVGDIARSLDRARAENDLAAKRRILHRVGDDCRTALSRLRLLVPTLRAPAADGDSVNLAAAVEWFEDELVSHGFAVEIEGDLDRGLDAPSVVSRLLHLTSSALTRGAPPGALVVVSVDTSSGLRISAACPEHTAGPSEATLQIEHRATAMGGSLAVDTTDGLTLTLSLPCLESPSGRRGPLSALSQDRRALAIIGISGVVASLIASAINVAIDRSLLDSLQWLVVSAGLLLAVWRPWAGVAILLFEVAVLSYLLPPQDLWATSQPSVAGIVLTIIAVSRVPWTAPALLVGWALFIATTPWNTALGPFDSLSMSGPAVLVGLGSHYFITVKRRQARAMAALEQERAAARLAERRALASELHDIVAHQLSLISMFLTPTALEEDRIDDTIEQLSRTTLSAKDDLTTLLFSLQSGEVADTGAQPVRYTASAMVETLRQAGHPTELVAPPSLDVLDSTTQKTLSRIVRESATNAIRYAAEDSPVAIRFSMTPASVSLRVTSRLAATRQQDPDSTGSGLLGLRERVEFTHGTLNAGEVGEEWLVDVTLPTAALVTAS